MQTPQVSQKFFLIYSASVAILAILILGGMVSSPSEASSRLFLGLSLPRLTIAGGLFAAFLFFVFLAVKALRDRSWAERTVEQWFGTSRLGRGIAWLSGIGFGLGWIGCFLPFYRAGILGMHWERLQEIMVFLLLFGLATLIFIFLRRINFTIRNLNIPRSYKPSLLLMIPSLAMLGLMLYTDFGVHAPEDYWYGAGVPILVLQLLTALAGGVLFLQAEKRWNVKGLDLLLTLAIYIAAAILWTREPLNKSFLFIGPYAPNRALYPFADGALYDSASQFALIGQNFLFYNGPFFERALYASFLLYLHSIVGQDYAVLMGAQAAIFAVFPALMYLIGKSLNVRAIGFAAALVAMFRGANAIAASNMIDMANPKMMLTDFPTALGMALVIYFTCEWLKQPSTKWYYAVWVGGVIGLATMLRTNVIFILLLVPLYTLITFAPAWKRWFASSILLVLAVIVVTLPWELRNHALGGTMYSSVFVKLQSVIEQRYTPASDPESSIPREQQISSLFYKQLEPILGMYPKIGLMQRTRPCDNVICFISNHFLHNTLTSILVLPTSPVLDDLRQTVKESNPYWRPDWDGTFTAESLLIFLLNIFFIVLGIRIAWERHRWIGLVPLAVFVFYNVSNGFARTSGGRYIVPIDWIIIFYFLVGVFQTIVLLANALGANWTLFQASAPLDPLRSVNLKKDAARAITILGILFGLGSLIPLAENLYPTRYQDFDIPKALLDREAQITDAGLSMAEIDSFLQSPNAEVSVGRALYPRYYIENEGEVHFYPVVVMGFPRTTFTLIGPAGEKGIVLPGKKPDYFPHAVDTIVLGCKEQYYVDALAVILLDDAGRIYTRSPASSLQCPLKQPVCDNNHNCY